MADLAALLDGQGKYDEAEALYRRALSIFEKALGPKHPKVRTYRQNYAGLLRAIGRKAEALALKSGAKWKRSLKTRRSAGSSSVKR